MVAAFATMRILHENFAIGLVILRARTPGRADEMYRGRDIARKLETWNRELQIGIFKRNDRIEQGHRQRPDAHGLQGSILGVRRRADV